jgi:hypothetical protein
MAKDNQCKRSWFNPYDNRSSGQPMKPNAMKFTIAFSKALKRYSELETERRGRKVSQSTILATTAIRHIPELKAIMDTYLKDEQEKQDGAK